MILPKDGEWIIFRIEDSKQASKIHHLLEILAFFQTQPLDIFCNVLAD